MTIRETLAAILSLTASTSYAIVGFFLLFAACILLAIPSLIAAAAIAIVSDSAEITDEEY